MSFIQVMDIKAIASSVIIFLNATASAQMPVLGEWDFTKSTVAEDGAVVVADLSGRGNDFTGKIDNCNICAEGLKLNVSELTVGHNQPLPYMDMRKCWTIDAEISCNTLGTEQVFINKEGRRNSAWGKNPMMPYLQGPTTVGDLSIGFDNMSGQLFVEVRDVDDCPHRLCAGPVIEAGKPYAVSALGVYDDSRHVTAVTLNVNGESAEMEYPGIAMQHNAGRWVIGHGYPGGFPNSLQVRDGVISKLRISGEDLPRVEGQNPIFTDRMTADPAITVIGDRLYAYVGEDCANPGGWFTMPHWLCYSTDDMRNWTAHGPVLRASDFRYSPQNSAWAGQVVEANGKYYYYVTLDRTDNREHTIDVAVSDSPTGPFVPARKSGTPLIEDSMTPDSHRWNADIDPTVLIDDDGTPWMAWGNGDCYMVRLKRNMTELDGEIRKVPMRNYSEGPFLIKRNGIYYMIYASDAPGVQAEQIAFSYTRDINGPWTFGGYITGSANHGFTIHPSVNEFKGQWYLFYHDGSYSFKGQPGGDCRRQVCVEPLYFEADGSIRPISLTVEGVTALD